LTRLGAPAGRGHRAGDRAHAGHPVPPPPVGAHGHRRASFGPARV